jgi:hypothetical protein
VTEAEWESCDDAAAMIAFAYRKGVLLRQIVNAAVGCGMVFKRNFPDPALAVIKRVEAGQTVPPHVMDQCVDDFHSHTSDSLQGAMSWLGLIVGDLASGGAVLDSMPALSRWLTRMRRKAFGRFPDIIRECVQPFRPSSPIYPTPEINAMIEDIVSGERFRELPVVADALEDAGCTDQRVLAHLRSGVQHRNGCWALELLR